MCSETHWTRSSGGVYDELLQRWSIGTGALDASSINAGGNAPIRN
jgi:hypothetical protein